MTSSPALRPRRKIRTSVSTNEKAHAAGIRDTIAENPAMRIPSRRFCANLHRRPFEKGQPAALAARLRHRGVGSTASAKLRPEEPRLVRSREERLDPSRNYCRQGLLHAVEQRVHRPRQASRSNFQLESTRPGQVQSGGAAWLKGYLKKGKQHWSCPTDWSARQGGATKLLDAAMKNSD